MLFLNKEKLNRVSEYVTLGILQEAIKKYLLPNSDVLEIACSVGETAKVLKEMGCNLHLTDFKDFLNYEELRKDFFLCDLNTEQLKLENNSVDAVVALNVVEHLENPFHFARECSRVLKPGGYLFMSMPNGHNIYDKIKFLFEGNVWPYRMNNNHITFFLKDVFNKVFKDFKVLDIKNGHSWIPFLWPTRLNKKWRKWLELKCPRWSITAYGKFYVMKKIN